MGSVGGGTPLTACHGVPTPLSRLPMVGTPLAEW